MSNKILSVKSVEYVKTENNGNSSGYSYPSIYKFTFEDNSSKLVKIDTWYAPEESLRREFNKGVENLNIGIDNPHRAFEMFLVTGVENKQFNVNIDYLKEE